MGNSGLVGPCKLRLRPHSVHVSKGTILSARARDAIPWAQKSTWVAAQLLNKCHKNTTEIALKPKARLQQDSDTGCGQSAWQPSPHSPTTKHTHTQTQKKTGSCMSSTINISGTPTNTEPEHQDHPKCFGSQSEPRSSLTGPKGLPLLFQGPPGGRISRPEEGRTTPINSQFRNLSSYTLLGVCW